MMIFSLLMARSAMLLWMATLMSPFEVMFDDIDRELERRGVYVSALVP